MWLAKITPVAMAILLVPAALAQDCRINDAERSDLGPNAAISGTCSNNGLPIQCSSDDKNIVTCGGPDGSYSGDDLDALVASACGCND
jgi:hypothetical protein